MVSSAFISTGFSRAAPQLWTSLHRDLPNLLYVALLSNIVAETRTCFKHFTCVAVSGVRSEARVALNQKFVAMSVCATAYMICLLLQL
jgi:hypothetical protein